jgi:hypothetical protein
MNETFIENLAKSTTGKDLIKYLKGIEIYYADIRNLNGVPAEVRIDALRIFREALLDKLLVMSGEIEPPNNDEYH